MLEAIRMYKEVDERFVDLCHSPDSKSDIDYLNKAIYT
jgi:hypothetical protein